MLFHCLLVYKFNRMICVNVLAWLFAWEKKAFAWFLETPARLQHPPTISPHSSFFSTAFQHISMYKSFLFLSSSHALKAQACKYLSSHKHLRKAEKIHQSDDEIYFMALWSLKVILPSSSSTSTVSSSAFELNVINLVAMCFMRVLWMYNHESWQSASSLLRERY